MDLTLQYALLKDGFGFSDDDIITPIIKHDGIEVSRILLPRCAHILKSCNIAGGMGVGRCSGGRNAITD